MTRLFSPLAMRSRTSREVPFSIIAGEQRITHGGILLKSRSHPSTESGMSTLGRSKGFSCMRMDSFIMLIDFWNSIMLFFARGFR